MRKYISPFFLVRYYLSKDISNILKRYEFSGNILDFGCGEKPFEKLFSDCQKYEGIDFKNYSKNKDLSGGVPDHYFSSDYLKSFSINFSDNSFDNIVSFQVLEHHKNPEKMIKELWRILKPNGYLLLSVPFLGGIHEEPNDFQRFTKYGLIELFNKNNLKIIRIVNQGSIFSTISMLFNEYLNNYSGKSKKNYFFGSLLFTPFLFLSYVSLIMDLLFKSKHICFNYLILARK